MLQLDEKLFLAQTVVYFVYIFYSFAHTQFNLVALVLYVLIGVFHLEDLGLLLLEGFVDTAQFSLSLVGEVFVILQCLFVISDNLLTLDLLLV